MREAQIQTLLGKYLREAMPTHSMCIELKIEKSKSFAFNKVADHQIFYLKQAKKGLYYKIPDMYSMDGYAAKKPFDTFWVKTKHCYVAICFYSPRKFKKTFFIDVDDFVKMRDESLPRKSITIDTLESHPSVKWTLLL